MLGDEIEKKKINYKKTKKLKSIGLTCQTRDSSHDTKITL
jgi:hypothetical protein